MVKSAVIGWRAFFDERAGIVEFDGGLSRDEPEACALEVCVTEWLCCNTTESAPDIFAGCGGGQDEDELLTPYGTSESGYSWRDI